MGEKQISEDKNLERKEQEIIESLRVEFGKKVPDEYLDLIRSVDLHLENYSSAGRFYNIEDEEMKRAILESEFIDLGCGDIRISTSSVTAKVFSLGADHYFGIDLAEQSNIGVDKIPIYESGKYALQNSIGPVNIKSEKEIYMQDDMLGAISKIQEPRKRVFLLSGIQEGISVNIPLREKNRKYFELLWQEMSRITTEGSAVILVPLFRPGNSEDPSTERAHVHAEKYGFVDKTPNKGEDTKYANFFIFVKGEILKDVQK